MPILVRPLTGRCLPSSATSVKPAPLQTGSLWHEAIADEFAARVTERVQAFKVGRGTEDGVQIGPLINADAVDKANALVRDATDRGARC